MPVSNPLTAEIAAITARIVVEEGLEWGPAKRRAVREMGLPARTPLPDNDQVEDAVREYLDIFCADTQPLELRALRQLALVWMVRMAEFRPHLAGSVWHGTATRHSDVFIQLFVDDEKSVEWVLLDKRVNYHPGSAKGWRGEMVPVLTVPDVNEALDEPVLVHLMLHPSDDVRGALKPDAMGRAPRGGVAALRELMEMNT